jgi:hypothetical protein
MKGLLLFLNREIEKNTTLVFVLYVGEKLFSPWIMSLQVHAVRVIGQFIGVCVFLSLSLFVTMWLYYVGYLVM